MPTKVMDNQANNDNQGASQDLSTILTGHVLRSLGHPDDLLMVKVHHLWDNKYRVNVFTGRDVTSAMITHSFFLVVDGEGNIVAATPEITRQY